MRLCNVNVMGRYSDGSAAKDERKQHASMLYIPLDLGEVDIAYSSLKKDLERKLMTERT